MKVFIFVLMSFFVKKGDFDQSFVEGPKNFTLSEGEDAILKCIVKDKKGNVVWCIDESFCTFIRPHNDTRYDLRHGLIVDEVKGEYNLKIKNVSIVDNTKYQCQVTATDNYPSIKSDWSYLTVLVKPESTKMLPNFKDDPNIIRLILNQSNSIECSSDNTNPECDFKWFLDNKELKTGGEIVSVATTSKKNSNKLSKSTGKITLKPNAFHDWDGKILKCYCKNEASSLDSVYYHDSKRLVLHYQPILNIIKRTDETIISGKFIQFECHSNAIPSVENYKWSIDDKVFANGNEEKFLNLKIDSSMQNKSLKCEAKNEVASVSASYRIDISYPPKFINDLPSHLVVNLNENLHLKCDVDSNPKASILWIVNDTKIYNQPLLLISSIKAENYGTYKCLVTTRDFPDIYASVKVIPPGPPVISGEEKQQIEYGDEDTIECLIENEPKPDFIEWYRLNTKLVPENDPKYIVKNIHLAKRGIKSMLTIRQVDEIDLTNFTCKASNKLGSASFQIKVFPKDKSFLNFYPLSIIIGVMISITLIVLFQGYFRLFKTQEKEKSVKGKNANMNQIYFCNKNKKLTFKSIQHGNSKNNLLNNDTGDYLFSGNEIIGEVKKVYETDV